MIAALGSILAVTLTAGFIGSTVALNRTSRHLDRTAASFQIAHSAVEEVFMRMDQAHELEPLSSQPARKALLGSLLHYYENILDLRGRDPRARDLAAEAQHRIARIDSLIGLSDVAAWQLERAAERYEELIAQEPGEHRYALNLAQVCDELGELLLSADGRGPVALAALTKAVGMLESEPADGPTANVVKGLLARALIHLAEAQRAAHQPEQAQVSITRAIDILNGLGAKQPQNVDERAALATAQVGLGRLLAAASERPEQAVEAFTAGIDARRAIIQEFPDRHDQAHELALDLGEMAAAFQKSEALDSATQFSDQAVEQLERLARRFPDSVTCQKDLYVAYDFAAKVRAEQGETRAALKLANQARTVLEALMDHDPKNVIFQIDLARCQNLLGRLLCRSRQFAEGLRAYQRAVDLLESVPKLDPQNSYQLAVNLALCVSLIGAGPAAPPPDDEAALSPADRLRRQVYGTRAVAILDRAVKGGMANPELCQSDADLDALRDRPDFQKLAREVEHGKK
jgi:tetratricopeptide (TPR) repeat protein